jgi:cell division protein FtsW
MPAPFFSYGGSNMVASLMAVGLICSVAFEECNPNYSERWLNAFFEKLSFIGRIFGKK